MPVRPAIANPFQRGESLYELVFTIRIRSLHDDWLPGSVPDASFIRNALNENPASTSAVRTAVAAEVIVSGPCLAASMFLARSSAVILSLFQSISSTMFPTLGESNFAIRLC